MLFEPVRIRSLPLTNRLVMAPMTRSRAVVANTPNALMAEYYAQRASAGLIVSEATAVAPEGLGYPRMPGLYDAEHVRGWRLTAEAVHARGGKILAQLIHTGRVAQVANLPAGAEVLAPVAGVCPGEIYTDALGLQPFSPARAMTEREIAEAVAAFARSAALAIEAGFDGVEIHAANGYLIEQFLNANVNRRADGYGGDGAGRNRFALEVTRAAADAIGPERVGIRLSPYGVFNATGAFPDLEAQYLALCDALSALGLLYLHVLDHSAQGAPPVPDAFKLQLRRRFAGPFILAGGFDRASAEAALAEGQADLIGFGRPFIANPDLVERLRADAPLNPPDPATFYTPDARGYTDYPMLGAD